MELELNNESVPVEIVHLDQKLTLIEAVTCISGSGPPTFQSEAQAPFVPEKGPHGCCP